MADKEKPQKIDKSFRGLYQLRLNKTQGAFNAI